MGSGDAARSDDGAALRCPACRAPLASPPRGASPGCPDCGARFRSPLVAALMSAALPGAGHIYLGRRALGLAELAGGLALFCWAMTSLFGVFLTVIDEGTSPLTILAACVPWAFVLAAYCLLDGVFTWIVSRRYVVL